MTRTIRTLLFSTLYPSTARPGHGLFVETRLHELIKTGSVETKVVAPVPWFPFSSPRFGDYGKLAATPRFERRSNIDVHHPRYFLPPRVGMTVAPYLMALGALPTVRRLLHEGFDFDLIDSHYFYPDGVAAHLIARAVNKPFVVTARGSDINLIADYPRQRRLIKEAASASAASIGVSRKLVERLAELGAPPSKLRFFRNGVDLDKFTPEDRATARLHLGLTDRPTLLSVGNLIELKGHHIAIEALSLLNTIATLAIIGSGPEEANLRQLASELGVQDRVIFPGRIESKELKWWFSAADILTLCSSREGWPNVLLEAMACGTPVVATAVGGIPEIVTSPSLGRLLNERDPQSLANTLTEMLSTPMSRSTIRKHAENYSWEETSMNQLALFREIVHA